MEKADKKIGIVVCNYNKEDYIINCVKSIFDQSLPESYFDVFVVDNASTDDSVKKLKNEFGDKITLIENKENLGGSGGFNTGLREALRENYPYFMCVDNDVVFDKEAIEKLYDFIETHKEMGMAGSKIFYMDEPDRLWSFGGNIDFDRYVQKDNYRNLTDNGTLPEYEYCTYVPACSLIIRRDAIEKAGIMPEDNFIYWDDMEWGYRVNKAGYKVAVYSGSKVWHKCGGRNSVNTFNNYYMWRNRINFFLKVLDEKRKEDFTEKILGEMFGLVYSCHLKKDDGVVKSVMYAFNDAVNGIRGKAPDYKIFERNKSTNRVKDAIGNAKSLIIKFNGDYEGLGNIVKNIRSFNKNIDISIYCDFEDCHVADINWSGKNAYASESKCTSNDKYLKNGRNVQSNKSNCEDEKNRLKKQYPDCKITDEYRTENYEKHLIMCEHIFKLPPDAKLDVYIDSWCNILYTDEDFMYAKSHEMMKKLFVLCKKGLLVNSGYCANNEF